MEYMLMFKETTQELAKRDSAAEAPAYWGAWNAYVRALASSGVSKGGNGLQPPRTGTTVRIKDGKRTVQDGPFADAKEHLGGYFVIDVASLDEALEWAARSPAASGGSVEVRPILPPPMM
ncbi:MAG: hypothetical protein H7X95_14755 [Deltaproteobacteria bacterium]|nr:hypothetical protein [Deltaproteobacteria bacterium]